MAFRTGKGSSLVRAVAVLAVAGIAAGPWRPAPHRGGSS
jgi:hypothetical protein